MKVIIIIIRRIKHCTIQTVSTHRFISIQNNNPNWKYSTKLGIKTLTCLCAPHFLSVVKLIPMTLMGHPGWRNSADVLAKQPALRPHTFMMDTLFMTEPNNTRFVSLLKSWINANTSVMLHGPTSCTQTTRANRSCTADAPRTAWPTWSRDMPITLTKGWDTSSALLAPHKLNWNVSGKNHVGCSLSRNPLHMRKLMKSPCQVSAPVLTITDAQNIILILVLFLAEFTMITMFEPTVDTACNNQSPESSIQLQTSAVIYRRKFLYDWTSWLLLIAQKTIVIQSTLSCSKYANKYWSC